jgi:diketogulonate reductase-like aldo/keto reductase
MRRIPTREMNDGRELPVLGFGTFPHAGNDAADAVERALQLGYRLLDTALRYENEAGVGEGIRRSGVPRHEVVVTSKLPGRYHGRDEVRTAVAESLGNLGLECIDLYLIHWPLPRIDRFVDSWRTMIELRDEGVLGSIGVSNFEPEHLRRLIEETGVVPAVNQVELHPFFPQDALLALHRELGIVTEAWSPLGRGGDLLDEPVLAALAEKYGTTTAQVVLRWHLQRGVVPVPMSSNADRQAQNRDVFDFALESEEIVEISALERGRIWEQDPNTHEEF